MNTEKKYYTREEVSAFLDDSNNKNVDDFLKNQKINLEKSNKIINV